MVWLPEFLVRPFSEAGRKFPSEFLQTWGGEDSLEDGGVTGSVVKVQS